MVLLFIGISFGAVNKEEPVKRVRIANPEVDAEKSVKDKDEYINHFHTPKTSPEPSPIKKKVKENPLDDKNEEQSKRLVEESKKKEEESKKIEEESKFNENNGSNPDEVSNEVSLLIQNLQDEIKVKGQRIKFIESEQQGLETKVKSLKTEVELSKDATKKVTQEKECLHAEYVRCCNANKAAVKGIEKLKSDYKECSQQLNFSQRKSEELAETLKVTEAVLQAQEEEEENEYENNDEDEEPLKDEPQIYFRARV